MSGCSIILYVALCVFALTQIGEGIRCYHCVDPVGGKCDFPVKNNVEQKDCNDPDFVCYIRNTTTIINGTIEANATISRGCAHRNTCDPRAANVTHRVVCSTCEKDSCNTSGNMLPTYLAVGIAAMFIAKHFS